MPLSDHTGSLLPLALPLSLVEMSKYRYTETASVIMINSFLASDDFCRLLVAYANSLDPDQDRHNVGPDLDIYCLTL